MTLEPQHNNLKSPIWEERGKTTSERIGAHVPKRDPRGCCSVPDEQGDRQPDQISSKPGQWVPEAPAYCCLFEVLGLRRGDGKQAWRSKRGKRSRSSVLADPLATEPGLAGSGKGFSSGLRCSGQDLRSALPIQKPLASFPNLRKMWRLLFTFPPLLTNS